MMTMVVMMVLTDVVVDGNNNANDYKSHLSDKILEENLSYPKSVSVGPFLIRRIIFTGLINKITS